MLPDAPGSRRVTKRIRLLQNNIRSKKSICSRIEKRNSGDRRKKRAPHAGI